MQAHQHIATHAGGKASQFLSRDHLLVYGVDTHSDGGFDCSENNTASSSYISRFHRMFKISTGADKVRIPSCFYSAGAGSWNGNLAFHSFQGRWWLKIFWEDK